MTKQEKMKIYRKRQILLVIGILIVIAAVIFVLVMLLKDDAEPINNSAVSPTASSENTDYIAADVKEQSSGSLYFKQSEITIKKGESRKLEVVNETGSGGEYIWKSSNISVAIVENGVITGVSEGSCDISVAIAGTSYSAKIRVFVESAYEIEVIDGLTYVYGILIANKSYSLPADYDPGVNEEALAAFDEMAADAATEGLDIYISSGYRSYYDQERIYNSYVESDGKELADTYSSRPGYSDHQTGLAFDLNSIDDSFGYTPESDWVAENAHKYGFIIRYPEGKDEYTGYQYEPWHIRYIGIEKANEVYESGLSLEEFLGIDSSYKD